MSQLTGHAARVFATQNFAFLEAPDPSTALTPAWQKSSVNDGLAHDSVHRSQLSGHRAAAPDPAQNLAFLVAKPPRSSIVPVVPATQSLFSTSVAAHVSAHSGIFLQSSMHPFLQIFLHFLFWPE